MPILMQLFETQHHDLEEDEPSPYLTDMENYYRDRSQRNRYRSAIGKAVWIPKRTRTHMIKHLDLLLKRRRVIVSSRRRGLRYILKHPEVEKVSIKPRRISRAPIVWTRDKNGIHLRNPFTGRFLHQTDRERAFQRRFQRTHKVPRKA